MVCKGKNENQCGENQVSRRGEVSSERRRSQPNERARNQKTSDHIEIVARQGRTESGGASSLPRQMHGRDGVGQTSYCSKCNSAHDSICNMEMVTQFRSAPFHCNT